jgi:hypothetical protein
MIIYSCITNQYDNISNDHYYDPEVRYVMFHDGTIEKKGSWEFIELDIDENSHTKKSYHPKHLPHLYFDYGECTVWIDGCYIITEDFVNFSKKIFETHNLVLQNHPSKRTLVEEFAKLYYRGFVDEEKCYELAEKIYNSGYKCWMYDQTINCCVWRKINKEVIDWNNSWHKWFIFGDIRDQIASSLADYETFSSHKIELIVDLNHTTRNKKYSQSYELLEHSDLQHLKVFISNISNKLVTNSKLSFHSNKVLDENENKLYNSEIKVVPIDKNENKLYNSEIEVVPINKNEMIIYSCITNGYDEIPDHYYDPEVRYVMFHDGTIEKKDPWEFIDIRDYCDLECPLRLSNYPKTNPHLFFEEGSNTIWIDGCYVMTEEFVKVSKKTFPFTILRHPFKFSYYDEMLEGFLSAFFSFDDGIEFTKLLFDDNYNFKQYSSPLCTIVYRTTNSENQKFNECWWKYSLIGPNRDQVAFDAAIQFTNVFPNYIEKRNDCGIILGSGSKIGRKKKHEQRGKISQWKMKQNFIDEMRKYAKLHPHFYAKHDHYDMMINNNIISSDKSL